MVGELTVGVVGMVDEEQEDKEYKEGKEDKEGKDDKALQGLNEDAGPRGAAEERGEGEDERSKRMRTVLEDLRPMAQILQSIVDDRTVPKNIRAAVEDALNALARESPRSSPKEDKNLRVSTAISVLDDIINDANMPMYTRMQIWNVVSMLEQKRNE